MRIYILLIFPILFLSACAHTSENIVGYNEKGQTIVKVCKSRGTLSNIDAFGSSCKIELRNYGRVSNTSDTVNIISTDKR